MSPAERPRVFVNAGGSNSGGGRTWVLALVDELERGGGRDLDWELLVRSDLADRIEDACPRVVRVRRQPLTSAVARIAWEQVALPLHAAVREADVLVSAANFATLARRRPQVLLVRNALHFDELRVAGLRGVRMRVETALARASVGSATVAITASAAMSERVRARTGHQPVVIPFGPGLVRGRAATGEDRFVFAHRTFWGPHKRLGELLAAVERLAAAERGRFVLRTACDPRTPFARSHRESAAERALLQQPQIAGHVEFETFPPAQAAELRADAVVMPSTLESFCFPLAEAVGAGLPVVAAESDFARELCGESASYADPTDPVAFAAAMRAVMHGQVAPPSPEHQRRVSWAAHVDGLAGLCRRLAADA